MKKLYKFNERENVGRNHIAALFRAREEKCGRMREKYLMSILFHLHYVSGKHASIFIHILILRCCAFNDRPVPITSQPSHPMLARKIFEKALSPPRVVCSTWLYEISVVGQQRDSREKYFSQCLIYDSPVNHRHHYPLDQQSRAIYATDFLRTARVSL